MTRWIYTSIIILAGSQLFSQVQFSNLNEVLKYADKNSTVARESNIQRKISEQEVGIARTALVPKVNAFGTADYAPIMPTQVIPETVFGGQDGKYRKVQFGMPWNFSSGIELSIPLLNLEKFTQLQKAKLRTIEIDWAGKTRLENLHIQITQWYYQALAARRMLSLNEENILVVNELTRILEERKRLGILDPSDFNRSQNLQLNIQTAHENYKNLWQQSVVMLRSLLNIPATVAFELRDSITVFQWPMHDSNNSIKVGHRSTWKEAIAHTEVAKQTAIESRRAALPKLSLSSRYIYNWQMNSSNAIHFDVNTIGLRIDYSIFNGGYHRRQQSKADLLLQSAYIHQQQTESLLVQQQQEWHSRYQTALTKRTILQAKVDSARDNLRIARLSLKEGVMEYDAFHNIFSEYIFAQMEQLQNLTDGIVYHLLLTNNIQ